MQQSNLNVDQLLIKKYLPHNFLAEKIILSCLLVNSEAMEITSQTLSIEAFYFKNHQEIYKALLFMHKNKMSIDILTLTTFLQDNGLLEEIGGIKVLIELISQLPNLVYLEDYILLVKDKFIRRCLIKLGYEVINSGYITNIPLETILNELENKLFYLTNNNNSQKFSNNVELLDKIFIELKTKSLSPNFYGLPSGFDDLDALTQGFQKSDLIIIAGRPSMGKTAFGLNLASNILKSSQLPVLFFSLEMSQEQIMYRLLSMEAGINQMKLKSGKLSQSDWIRLNKIIKIFSKLPFYIDDTFNLSIQDIRAKIKTILFEQNQLGLIIIDYIQLMENSKLKIENRVQELSKITRSLKTLAREFNVPIIALSQLSRNVENRMDKKPILSDLRESGSIEQDADLVMLLYRNTYYNLPSQDEETAQIIELILAKHRNGPIGTVQLKFDEKYTKFFSNK
jgi:replicative DNA helicase